MEFLQKIKLGIYNGIGFVLVLGITSVAYGAYTSMTDVTTGQSLTVTLFNQIQENIRVLRTDVDKSSPAGSVMAFNLSSCPSGWIAANGANGTPDLRGEFIRGLDSGRGVDSGRSLGTFEPATIISSPLFYGSFGGGTGFAGLGFQYSDTFVQQNYVGSAVTNLGSGSGWGNLSSIAAGDFTSRPRNVALLYCVKQ